MQYRFSIINAKRLSRATAEYPHVFGIKGGMEFDFWQFRHGVVEWCCDQFGPAAASPMVGRWDVGRTMFYFRDEADAVAFRMRWG